MSLFENDRSTHIISITTFGESNAISIYKVVSCCLRNPVRRLNVQHGRSQNPLQRPYQIVQGNELATPYCEDNFLAKIARSRGMKVSDRAVRNNPKTKERVCLFVGNDPRVSSICAGYTGNNNNKW